ncbi:hypothetical protein P3X46_003120 [Hevea brasiliensis]|uniref:Uncharacterized protein n=1 Tax=Hevea brasiliensis TaxID=3981 RepID=A0ABQ9N6Z0_HEVBR|nr:hypothetical protein P3X46_003120 [Hevea brasiliensis]
MNEKLFTELEDSTKLQTLHSILQHRAGVHYLRPHLSGYLIEAGTFRRQVQWSCYEDYADHINRMANGKLDHYQPVLSVDPLVCFLYSKAKWYEALSCTRTLEVVSGADVKNQMHCHLLCAQGNSDLIVGIGDRAPYAISLIRQLCDNLENRFPRRQITDPAMRESVANVLGGPQALNLIYQREFNPFLRKRIGMIVISLRLNVPLGVNLDIKQPPETTRFVMLPTAAYFEFLPFDLNNGSVGRPMRWLSLLNRGFNHYRLGDIVRVFGFHNSSLEVEFVMRAPNNAYEYIKPGSFDRILQMAVENGASASQYKPPKIIRNNEVVGVMESSAFVTVCLDSLD